MAANIFNLMYYRQICIENEISKHFGLIHEILFLMKYMYMYIFFYDNGCPIKMSQLQWATIC